ncbi:hypothetical protein [Streptomyces sp. NPDC046985]
MGEDDLARVAEQEPVGEVPAEGECLIEAGARVPGGEAAVGRDAVE